MVGNLTRDPEYKQQPSGQAVCRLSIASNRSYKNKQTGMLVQDVCYIDVDVWGQQAENCRQYLQKGRSVLIEGRLKLDVWQAPDGQTRRRHVIVAESVVWLGSGQQAESGDEAGQPEQARTSSNPMRTKGLLDSGALNDDFAGAALFKDEPPFEDDLPF